ncbi:MAG: protein kinase, partial [Eubacteriales bacterium]|nr:protein kinase [Eubacteriales bacterium]
MIEYKQRMAERDLAQVWPQWRIVRLLGMGSFGEVYEIHREEYGRISKCALKIIRKEKMSGLPGDLYANLSRGGTSDEFINTVIREIDIMETLKGASNVVVIDDYTVVRNEESDAVLIRMELLTNLGEYMTTRQVSMNDILRMGMDICTALDYCERQKIIHRDVKESNIF